MRLDMKLEPDVPLDGSVVGLMFVDPPKLDFEFKAMGPMDMTVSIFPSNNVIARNILIHCAISCCLVFILSCKT